MDCSQLESIGVTAYRNGDYDQAAAALKALVGKDPSKWEGRLYLAMAYSKMGRISNALQEFRDISEWCPDGELRDKATVALRAMNHISSQRIQKRDKN